MLSRKLGNFLIISLFLTLSLMGFSGCTGFVGRKPAYEPIEKSLQVEQVRSEELLLVNSVLAVPPKLPRELTGDAVVVDQVQRTYFDTVRGELGMELVTGSKSAVPTDATLHLTVHDYVSRVGSDVGAERPAKIYFSLNLVTPGGTAWAVSYTFTDKPLSENLLTVQEQLKGKSEAGWDTAASLLRVGLKSALRDLSQRRIRAFERHS